MYKKIVVKVGSSFIAPQGKVDTARVKNLIDDIAALMEKGKKVAVVSSGAIACGLALSGYKRRPQDIHSLMALASLGQVILMDVYNKKLKKYDKVCGQVLLTHDDFNQRNRYVNGKATVEKLFSLKVVPVINENDAISSEEIKFGDNDKLSALVSDLISADLLIILTNVDGLMDMSSGRLIEKVEDIASVTAHARTVNNQFTIGGMATKLEAARIANEAGIPTVIANGRKKGIVSRIVKGGSEGTIFVPGRKKHPARKRWIANVKRCQGRIIVDDGAREALLYRGKSLLACGITGVQGEFSRQDAVEVFDTRGNKIGIGLSAYASADLCRAGKKRFEKEVIHRDNFVIRGE